MAFELQPPIRRVRPPADPRVRDFLTWFVAEYAARMHGAGYLVQWGKHGALVKPMLAVVPVERLQQLAQVLLTSDDPWIAGTDRGIEVLQVKFNWLSSRLAAWEAKQQVSA